MPIRNVYRDTQFVRGGTRGPAPCLATPDIQLAERGLIPPSPAVAPIGKASRAARQKLSGARLGAE